MNILVMVICYNDGVVWLLTHDEGAAYAACSLLTPLKQSVAWHAAFAVQHAHGGLMREIPVVASLHVTSGNIPCIVLHSFRRGICACGRRCARDVYWPQRRHHAPVLRTRARRGRRRRRSGVPGVCGLPRLHKDVAHPARAAAAGTHVPSMLPAGSTCGL